VVRLRAGGGGLNLQWWHGFERPVGGAEEGKETRTLTLASLGLLPETAR